MRKSGQKRTTTTDRMKDLGESRATNRFKSKNENNRSKILPE